jgi:DNA polymerase-3 subunit alpha
VDPGLIHPAVPVHVAIDPDDESADLPPPPEFPPDWENYALPNRQYRFAVPQAPEAAFFPPEKPPESPAADETEAGGGPEPTQAEPIRPLVAPQMLANQPNQGRSPEVITIFLRSTGELDRDRRRIQNVYGIITSYPGRDRFSFFITENGRGHQIDFPNITTRICEEMLQRLRRLTGEESWRIEPLAY